MSTQSTLAHHLQALNEDIDSIMSDYAQDAVLLTPDGPVKGFERIRSHFGRFLDTAPRELVKALTLIRQDIDGEVAYILWKADPSIALATDTFVIRDGKIVAQTFAALTAAAANR
jgi:ketosteroid isomerase-like protein